MKLKWVRSNDGMIFGVCKGLANSLEISTGLLRLIFVFSVLFFGVGIGLYLLFSLCLPREDKMDKALEPQLLGVCAKVAVRTDLEVGVVRVLCVCLAIMSFGATIVGYIVLYFVLDTQASSNRPNTPPSMT